MSNIYQSLINQKLFFILLLILLAQFPINPISFLQTSEMAHARSKSSGNEAKREIQTGLDLTGRTKTEVLKLIGPPLDKEYDSGKSEI